MSKKQSYNISIYNLIVLVVALLFIVKILLFSYDVCVLTFVVIICLSLYSLLCLENYPISLNKLYSIFYLVFFGVAPLSQYLNNNFPWGGNFTQGVIVYANIIIILSLLIHILIYTIWSGSKRKTKAFNPPLEELNYSRLLIFLLLSSCVLLNVYSINELLFRGEMSDSDAFGFVSYFSNYILRYAFPIGLIWALYFYKSINMKVFLLMMLVLIFTFPLGMSRASMLSIYLGILIAMRVFKKSSDFTSFLFVVCFVLYPLFGVFRYLGEKQLRFSVVQQSFDNLFVGGNYDAYSMFIRAISYVGVNGFMPKQLAPVLLFFIPRGLWPNKPVSTGTVLAHYYNLPLFNVSSPLLAEGYVFGGFFFALIYGVVISIVLKYLDKTAWNRELTAAFFAVYVMFSGFLYNMLRGSLNYASTVLVGFLIAVWVMQKICIKKTNK